MTEMPKESPGGPVRPSLSALAVGSAVLGCLSLALGLPVYVLPPPFGAEEFWSLPWEPRPRGDAHPTLRPCRPPRPPHIVSS